jgi:CRP-like cAMP-binding protein
LLKKGKFFIRAGETPFSVGYLVSGFLRYFYPGHGGKEFVKHFCFDGHFVTSHNALVSGCPSEYSIEALEDCRLIVFAYGPWLELLQGHPAWGMIHAKIQSDALVLAEKRERSLLLDDATTRYLKLLDEVPGIESRVRQYDLANYLGITPVALSRLRAKPLRKLT